MRLESEKSDEIPHRKGRRGGIAVMAPVVFTVTTRRLVAIAMAMILRGGVPSTFVVVALLTNSPSPPRRVHHHARIATTTMPDRRVTRIAYKDGGDDDDDERDDALDSKYDALESVAVGKRRVDVRVEVGVEIDGDVVYHDELGGDKTEVIPDVDGIASVVETDYFIHELKADAKTEKRKPVMAVKPSIEKPAMKFVSPIQLIKLVPKVVPLSMSTVFFLRLVGEWPALSKTTGRKKGGHDDKRRAQIRPPLLPPPPASGKDENGPPKAAEVGTRPRKTIVESWKTRMAKWTKKSTAFSTTSYLESLSKGVPPPPDGAEGERPDDIVVDNEDDDVDKEAEELLRSLRNQRDQFIEGQRDAMSKAMRDATRRTNPAEVIARRNEEALKAFEEKERTMLERLYAERRERLDAKRRMADDRTCSEEKQRVRGEGGEPDDGDLPNGKRRTIPVLDILLGKTAALMPPLLVGGALTIPYADLTPYQRRALDAATSNHEDSRGMMIVDDHLDSSSVFAGIGENAARIAAAPLVAIIDDLTASSSSPPSLNESRGGHAGRRRYATLASIEILKDGNDREGDATAVRFTGVGRAFLGDCFRSKEGVDSSRTVEEDVSNVLGLDSDEGPEGIPVISTSFDVFLDDPFLLADVQSEKNGASSVHAIAELYRAANRVYRLHEERKRLVAGLRAGVARLRLGKRRVVTVHLDPYVEFEDCDGLSLVGRASSDDVVNDLEWSTPSNSALWKDGVYDDSILRELEAMKSYGILSTIPDLTHELMSQLEPYYSSVHRERDEYEAEVASMAALRTLEDFATPVELAAGLLAPSAAHRLELTFDVMMRHKEKLHELVRIINEELTMDCGEESTPGCP
jgi:hypothetical protein